MKQYKQLLSYCLNHGEKRTDRTGTGTLSVFGFHARYNLNDGFPLLTTKKLHFKSIVHELLWFLRGDTNIKYLTDNGITIWNEWALPDGSIGRGYGAQWRNYGNSVDQIKSLIDGIKKDPYSRRHIVTAWNPMELDQMALPPCHTLWQCYVSQPTTEQIERGIKGNLSIHLYQRSGDIFLGIPYNIASYSLLCMMIAQVCDMEPKEFVHSIGDAHLYINHIEQANLQLTREHYGLPTVILNKGIKDIFDFTMDDVVLEDYKAHPAIKGKVAV